jgi:hypothetical protein
VLIAVDSGAMRRPEADSQGRDSPQPSGPPDFITTGFLAFGYRV